MFKNIKGVIFDLDGTLVDSMGIWYKIDVEFLNKRGFEVPENINKMTEGKSFTETAQLFKETFMLRESIDEIKAEWIKLGKEYYSNQVPLKPGVKELLALLKKMEMKLGIASSCSRELLEAVLKQHQIQHYFHTIVTSCEVKQGKPFPDVFMKAAENLKISNEQALAFEDTVAGVMAAKAAGMKVIAVYDDHAKGDEGRLRKEADYYIDSMEALLQEEERVG
ncbi:HAD family hydrolase [Alkaliphilus crotonatoxidans]